MPEAASIGPWQVLFSWAPVRRQEPITLEERRYFGYFSRPLFLCMERDQVQGSPQGVKILLV